VLKPSEVTPLNAFLLAELLDELGLPPGVFNLVTGYGPVVGEAIASHPDVDMISFTGSTRAGRRVAELAAQSIKRVTLELGGKSPNVILDDANLEEAVTDGVAKCYLNSGQTCSALTRMLVPRARLEEAEGIAAAVAEHYAPGDPFDESTPLGPLVSEVQRKRVRAYIAKGLEEGAKLLIGGAEPPPGLDRGWYVRPTVFSEVTPEMTIAQEEIFGPVLVIMPYESEDEAVEIANHTVYGLAGGVWSADEERAKRVARRIRTGQIEINGAAFNPLAPFGGYKQSGYGRELGPFGLEEYLQVKSLQL
jgi:acyl-CoA reductase-like NAD-dependent aldehyde dehydrogenase